MTGYPTEKQQLLASCLLHVTVFNYYSSIFINEFTGVLVLITFSGDHGRAVETKIVTTTA